jgi:uncharacterized protein (DUF305 family)
MPRNTRVSFAIVGAVAAIAVGACGADEPARDGASPASAAHGEAEGVEFNDTDVAFATDMIPHHRQAVDMAELAESRAESAEVIDLAERIKAAQDPEIEQLIGMLTRWDQPLPSDDGSSNHGDDHGEDHGHRMPGMMTDEEMDELESASGPEFDRMCLELIIKHHEGAVDMADEQLADGEDDEARALAEEIRKAQQGEIAEMQALLDG